LTFIVLDIPVNVFSVGKTGSRESEDDGRHICRIDVTSSKGFGTKGVTLVDEVSRDGQNDVYVNYYISNGRDIWKASRGNNSENYVTPNVKEHIFKGGKFTGVKRYIPPDSGNHLLNPYSYIKANKIGREKYSNRDQRTKTIPMEKDVIVNIPNGTGGSNGEAADSIGHANLAFTDLDDEVDNNEVFNGHSTRYGSFTNRLRDPPTAQILPNTHENKDGDSITISITDENGTGHIVDNIRTSVSAEEDLETAIVVPVHRDSDQQNSTQ